MNHSVYFDYCMQSDKKGGAERHLPRALSGTGKMYKIHINYPKHSVSFVKGHIVIDSDRTRRCQFRPSRGVGHVRGSALPFLCSERSCFLVKPYQRKSEIGTIRHFHVIFARRLVVTFLVVHL